MSTREEEDPSQEQSPAPRIGNFRGVRVRRRVDPAASRERKLYRIVRRTKHSIRGIRVNFTIFDKDTPLFCTKMKGRHPTGPLPIAKGAEMHYRSSSFAAFLLSGNNHSQFSLRAREQFGNELLSIQYSLHDGRRSDPRDICINFFVADAIIPERLVNKRPDFNPDGYWELDFGDKPLISSIRNTIFIRETDKVQFVVVRKVAKNEIEVDSVEVISPLAVFAIVLSLFEFSV